MGTNYYFHEKAPCDCCKRDFESRHIGKSSAGWCFGLHIYPEDDINTLEDWKKLMETPGSVIKDEYGSQYTFADMLDTITNRAREHPRTYAVAGYESEQAFLRSNHAILGPGHLLRRQLGDHCVGHGSGTYDYIEGEFS